MGYFFSDNPYSSSDCNRYLSNFSETLLVSAGLNLDNFVVELNHLHGRDFRLKIKLKHKSSFFFVIGSGMYICVYVSVSVCDYILNYVI